MIPAKAGLTVFLFLLWALLPWPLLRWAAAFVACFLAFSALWSWIVARGLAAGPHEPVLRTFSGRRLDVATKLENRSPLPTGLLFVHDAAGGLEVWGETRRFVGLRPFSRFRSSFTVRGRERGERALGPLRVSGSDPSGLFPFVRLAAPRRLIVYPPVHESSRWPLGGLPSGARLWEPAPVDDVSRFRSYRDFRPGDPLARLSASAWARRGHPQVRTFDFTVERPTGVVVDLRAASYPLRLRWALIEEAVEIAASLVWKLLGRDESVWLTVVDADPVTLGPGRGWASARPFLERLALASPDKADTRAERPPLPRGPARFLWVAPVLEETGRDTVFFAVEEGLSRALAHP